MSTDTEAASTHDGPRSDDRHGVVRDVVDGVKVLWTPAPGPLSASLVFAAGARDETLPTVGVTHMIEHLAMCRLPRLLHEHNGHVGADVTTFWATGTAQEVRDFLEAVCRGLSGLPLDEMRREAGVLEAEGGSSVPPVPATLLKALTGTRSLGLSAFEGAGPSGLSPEQVQEHAARWFTSGNAVLTLTGPPPEGLVLPLPHGPAPRRERLTLEAAGGPVWVTGPTPGIGIGFVGGTDDVVQNVVLGVLVDRVLQESRHRRGTSYCVEPSSFDVDADQRVRVLTVDARPGHDADVVRLVWQQLCDLAVHGPAPAELEHDAAGLRRLVHDEHSAVQRLDHVAIGELLGLPTHTPAELLARLEEVTAEEVRDTAAAVLESIVLVAPPGVVPDLRTPAGRPVVEGGCRRLDSLPEGRRYRVPLLGRLLSADARRAVLVRTAAGLAVRDEDGVHGVEINDAVGLMHVQGGVVLFGANGCHVPVVPGCWAGIEELVEELVAAVPAHLQFADPGPAEA